MLSFNLKKRYTEISMSRENKKSLKRQIQETYDSMLAIGQSKKTDKLAGNVADRIYSWETYRSYIKHACYFADWVKEQPAAENLGRKCRTLEEARRYVEAFLQNGIDRKLSAYTLQLQAAALAKLYGCHSTDFDVDLPKRSRANLTRSRGKKVRDANFNEELHKDLVRFCRCTGLRRGELEQIRGEDLREIDGKYFLEVTRGTKGGRPRTSPIVGTDEEVSAVVAQLRAAGSKKVYPEVSTNADVHGYRSDYATRVYNAKKRDLSEFKNERLILYKSRLIDVYTSPGCRRDPSRQPGIYLPYKKGDGSPAFLPGYKDVPAAYYCQKDLKKVVYDRVALLATSQALGHNRECVVPEHYLRA